MPIARKNILFASVAAAGMLFAAVLTKPALPGAVVAAVRDAAGL